MQFAELDAVTIDAYGTLVELVDPVPALRDALSRLGVEREPEAVRRAFATEAEYYRARSFRGRDDESLLQLRRECAGIVLRELHAELEPDAFVPGFVRAMRFEPAPGALKALAKLQRRGLAVAVVSNWDFGLGGHLRGLAISVPVVTSAEAGVAKPDPAIFERALGVLRVRPQRTLHVGDSPEDEAGARAAGVQFAPAPLADALEAFS